MKKILMLDIDGVIATPESIDESGEWNLTRKCQELLGEILDKTNAEIVISSSWRLHTVEDTIEYFKEKGFLYCDKIIGVTIRGYHHIKKGVHLSIPRGVEIKQWIDANIHSDNGKNWDKKEIGKDFNYVILDDDNDMLLEHANHFVNTDSEIGLTMNDVLKAIDILNGHYK